MSKETNIAAKFTPLVQAGIALLLGLTGIVITKFIFDETFYQFIAAFTGIVIYCLVNAEGSIFHDSFVRYTIVSWWLYVALVIVLLLAARFISGEHIVEHNKEFIQMLISLSLFYVVASLAVRGIRGILEFMDSEKR
ncbi:MAG TPA: hypothetical protein VGB95_06785 [Chitinophagales bacterium]